MAQLPKTVEITIVPSISPEAITVIKKAVAGVVAHAVATELRQLADILEDDDG